MSLVNGTATFNAAVTSLCQSLTVSNGTLTLSGGQPITISTLTQSGGTLTGSDTLTVSGQLTWTGGTMSGSGKTVADGPTQLGAPVGSSNSDLESLSARTLTLAGAATLNDTNNSLSMQSSATLQTLPGGSLDILAGSISGDASGNSFSNAGTLSVDAGSGASTDSVALTTSGSVKLNSGTLTLSAGGTETGSFAVASGATLDFNSGTFTMASGTSVNGAGTVETTSNFGNAPTVSFASGSTYNVTGTTSVTAGSLTFNTPVTSLAQALAISNGTLTLTGGQAVTVGTLTMSGGTLTGTDNVTVTGLLTWTGGTMSGASKTTADGPIQVGAASGSAGNGAEVLSARTFVWSGTGTLNDGTFSSLALQASATLQVLGGGSLDLLNGSISTDASATTFSHAGTLSVDAAAASTCTVSIALTDIGSVKVNSGTLSLTGGGTLGGSFTVASGATLDIDNGTFTTNSTTSVGGAGTLQFGSTFNSPTVTFVSGSAFDLTGSIVVNNGTATFNAPVTSLAQSVTISNGTLSLNAGQTVVVATLTETSGTLTGSDTLTVSGQLVWTGGTMSGSGKTVANGPAQLGAPVGMSNSDAESLSSRTFVIAGAATLNDANNALTLRQSAALQVQGGGSLDILAGSVSTDNSAVTFSNAGTLSVDAGSTTSSITAPFTNSGSVKLNSGTLNVVGGGSQTGSFAVASGTTLDFAGGTFTMASGSSVAGAGSVVFNSTFSTPTVTFASGSTYNIATATTAAAGTATFNTTVTSLGQSLTVTNGTLILNSGQPVTVSTLTQSGGILTDGVNLTVTGQYTWTGGALSGSGTTTADGPTQLGAPSGSAGSGAEALAFHTLALAGATTVNNVSFNSLALHSTAALQVLAGGSLDLLNGGITTDGSANTFTNAGTFFVDAGSASLTVSTAFTNTGTVSERSGVLRLTGAFTNFAGNTLTGGSYVVSNSTLEFNNASVLTNAANITLNGPSSGILDLNGNNALAGMTTNAAGASLTFEGGGSFGFAASFTNEGAVTIDSTVASTSFGAGTYAQSGNGASTTLVEGGTLVGNGSVSIGAGSSLQGTGTVQSNVTNSGRLSPGAGVVPGEITIQGTYTQTSTGELDVKLRGTTGIGFGFDAVSVSGVVALDGAIDVTEVSGYVPQANDTFRILFCGVTANPGDFSTRIGFAPGNGLVFVENFNPPTNTTSLNLTVEQTHLHFVTQPTDTVAGKAVDGTTGGVQVEILDPSGNRVTADNADQITLSAGTGTFTGGGPITVVNGVATFNSAAITAAGTNYQLTASAGSATAAVSNTFSITPDVTSQLVVTTQPVGGRVGDTLGAVVVTEEDQFNNVETGDNSGSVSLALSPNPGALSGTIPQTVVGGVATFGDLSVSQAGTGYVLTATEGGLSKASANFNITALATTTVAASESGTAGQNVTLQATVSAVNSSFPVNEGTVTFEVFNGATEVGGPVVSGTVTNGQASASFAIPTLTARGNYTIKAVYADASGSNFTGSQSDPGNNGTLAVSSIYSSTTTTAANASAPFSSASQSVTLSATVASDGGTVNAGTVTFAVFAGSTQIGSSVTSGTVTGGAASASFTLPAGTALGSYSIDATYNMGGTFLGSSDNTHQLTVSTASTTTTASSASASFSASSQVVTLSANVSSAGPVDVGTVTFSVFAGGTQIGTSVTSGTVNAGAASASFTLPSGTAAGSYSILATYNPGTGYNGSTDNTQQLTVSPASTTTTAANATAPFSTSSQAVTLSATVSSGGGTINSGTVTFSVFAGSTQIGNSVTSGTVASGAASASFTLPGDTPSGSYTIDATYNPGPNFATSSDNTHQLTIGAAPTTTAAANATATFNAASQSVTLSATVSSIGGTVNAGTVTFSVFAGSTQIGSSVTSGTVNAGAASASFTLPGGTAAGTYTIDASYNAGGSFTASSDNTHHLTVGAASTTTAVANASATFSGSSQSVTLGAAVTSSAGSVSGGTVTFSVFNGNTQIGSSVTSGTVSAGAASASFTLPAVTAAGTYAIHATYNPGSNFSTSSDNTHQLTVSAAATTTAAANVSAMFNSGSQPVILTATVSSAAGLVSGGTVTFAVFAGSTQIGSSVTSGSVAAGSVSATFTLPGGIALGNYTIDATYNASQNFAGSSDNTHQLTVSPNPSQPPVLPPVNGTNKVSLPFTQFPFSTPLDGVSPDGSPLSYSASAQGDSALFDLQQQYQFTAVGYNTVGATAYVLHSNQAGPGVGGYYLIRPSDGALFAYDGSGSYSHSFANSSPLATLGTNVYTDPTLLMSALPPADYATLQSLQATFQFTGAGYATAGATAYVLHSDQTGPGVGGYYLVRPSDGALFAYDGSGSFAHTFANGTPLATLRASVYSFPAELLNAQAAPSLYAQLYQVDQQLDLQELGGSFYTNTLGHQAEWLYSPVLNQYGQHWYTLVLNGTQSVLHAWEGYQDSAVGAVVATFNSASVYNSPTLLTNATYQPDPAAGTASVDTSGNLTINLPGAGFVGNFRVVVSASDGTLSSSESVSVNATGTAPTLAITNGGTTIAQGDTQTANPSNFPLSDTLTATAPVGTVSVSASAASFSLPFSLQQYYRFTGLGNFTAGAPAYVLQAAVNNVYNNAYYLLKFDGGLYAYDGSGSFASSFANGTPIANLGANVYADPNLLLNAQPAVDYASLFNLQQQFQFTGVGMVTAGATAYLLHSSQTGPGVGGYYLIGPAGGLYAYDGSGSFAHTFANGSPLATLDPGVYANPALLLNAKAAPALYPQLYQAEEKFDLQEFGGSFYTGQFGNAAKWLYSPIANASGQHWYTLVLAANGGQALLYAWNGGTNSVPVGSQPVAVLDPSVYADPTLLTNAKAPVLATGVSASVSGGTLTISAPASFVGTFQVTVTATDGSLSTTQTFLVNSTDTAPVPAAIANQTASQAGSPLQITLGTGNTPTGPVTYSASAVGYSAAFNLQQQYQFKGLGFFSAGGATAYLLQSTVMGGVGGFYLVSSTGGVYAYDGSGSYAHTFANSANLIATLDPSVFTTPTLLTQAQASATPAASVSVSGNTLTVNVAGVPVGTVFEVFVTASDGAESQKTGFLVTVTA
jgi:hypothetical protein